MRSTVGLRHHLHQARARIHLSGLIKWRKLHQQYAERAFSGNGQTYKDEARIADLERMLGQMTMENALLKKALSRLEAHQPPGRISGGKQ
jgi:transposase